MLRVLDSLLYGVIAFLIYWGLWSVLPPTDKPITVLTVAGVAAISAAFGHHAGSKPAKRGGEGGEDAR